MEPRKCNNHYPDAKLICDHPYFSVLGFCDKPECDGDLEVSPSYCPYNGNGFLFVLNEFIVKLKGCNEKLINENINLKKIVEREVPNEGT